MKNKYNPNLWVESMGYFSYQSRSMNKMKSLSQVANSQGSFTKGQ